jgi:hypothetical protein
VLKMFYYNTVKHILGLKFNFCKMINNLFADFQRYIAFSYTKISLQRKVHKLID